MRATWASRGVGALLLILAAWGFTYKLGTGPLLDDPNEGQYAEVAREMVESGDWISPRLNYVLFLNKPPLTYWLIGLADLAVGTNELAARLPSGLAGLLILLLLVRLGTRLFDVETGLLAGFVLFTTAGFFVETHAARPDLLLTASIVGSLLAFDTVQRTPRRGASGALIGLQVALAAGLLAKGILALLVPGIVFAVQIVAERRYDLVRRLLHPRAWWLFVLLVLPWHLAAGLKHPGFLWDYVVNQHVLFFLDRKFPRDSTPVSLGLFWAAFALRLFPWTLFAPLAVVTAARGARRGSFRSGDRLLLTWAAAVLLFFSAAPSRMEHYSIPALPPLALLIGKLFREYARGTSPRLSRVMTGHAIAFALLSLAGPFVAPRIVATQEWLAPLHQLPDMTRQAFGIAAAGAVAAAAAALARQRCWVAPPIVAAFVCVIPLVPTGLALLARVNSSAPMAAALRASVDPDERIIYEAPMEYQTCAGFNFYLRRKLDLLLPAGFVAPPYLEPHMADLFISPDRLQDLWRDERVFLITDPLASHRPVDEVVPQPSYIVAHDAVRWVVTNRPLH